MRNRLIKLLVGITITALGLFAADNSVGTWKLNIEKSKYTPGPLPYKSLTMTREAAEGGVKGTRTGVLADGSPLNSTYTAKFDGKEYPATGGPWDLVSIKQVDANTFTAETRKAGGQYHTTSRTTVSKDGKTLTTVATGVNADSKAIRSTLVYDRQQRNLVPSSRSLERQDGPSCGHWKALAPGWSQSLSCWLSCALSG